MPQSVNTLMHNPVLFQTKVKYFKNINNLHCAHNCHTTRGFW